MRASEGLQLGSPASLGNPEFSSSYQDGRGSSSNQAPKRANPTLLSIPLQAEWHVTAVAVPMSSVGVSKLISRSEFRSVLKSVVNCLRRELDAPGLVPLTAEEIHFWFQNITLEDVEAVSQEIDEEAVAEQTSRGPSMLQKLRERMRGSHPVTEGTSSQADLAKESEARDTKRDEEADE